MTHSDRYTVVDGAKPLPVTMTSWWSASLVFGVTVIVATDGWDFRVEEDRLAGSFLG